MNIKYDNGSPKKELTFSDVKPGQLFRFSEGMVGLKLNNHPKGGPLPINAVKLIRGETCRIPDYFPMYIAPDAVVIEILDITEIVVRRVE